MSREQPHCLCHFLAIVLSVLIAWGEMLSVTAWAWRAQQESAVA